MELKNKWLALGILSLLVIGFAYRQGYFGEEFKTTVQVWDTHFICINEDEIKINIGPEYGRSVGWFEPCDYHCSDYYLYIWIQNPSSLGNKCPDFYYKHIYPTNQLKEAVIKDVNIKATSSGITLPLKYSGYGAYKWSFEVKPDADIDAWKENAYPGDPCCRAWATFSGSFTVSFAQCFKDSDCDDSDPCTLDKCLDGKCINEFQDKDNDGICDAKDRCPDEAGLEQLEGCPPMCKEDADCEPKDYYTAKCIGMICEYTPNKVWAINETGECAIINEPDAVQSGITYFNTKEECEQARMLPVFIIWTIVAILIVILAYILIRRKR